MTRPSEVIPKRALVEDDCAESNCWIGVEAEIAYEESSANGCASGKAA